MSWEERTINVVGTYELLPVQSVRKFKPYVEVEMFYDDIWYYDKIIETGNTCSTLSIDDEPLYERSKTKDSSSVSDDELLSKYLVRLG